MDSSSSEIDGIQEDTDPNEEFEKKVQESYKMHKDSSRPNSSTSNRPLTATRHREDHDQRLALVTTTAQEVYSALATRLQTAGLSKRQLARSVGEFVTLEAFCAGLVQAGVHVTEDEAIIVFRDNGSNPRGGVLRMQDFTHKLPSQPRPIREEDSKDASNVVPQQLLHEAERLLEESNPRFAKKLKQKQRNEKTSKRPVSGSLRSGQSNKALRPVSAYFGSARSKKSNQTQRVGGDFLKMSKHKQEEADRELALTVEKCKKEFEYDCLHKMGEANEIVQNMGVTTNYRAIKTENGTTKCHIYENDYFVEEISLENFLREWRRLKRQQKPAINLPTAGATQTQASVTSKTTNSGKVNKKERQEELKHLLQETKQLTTKLKEQLKILEKKGIVSKSIHSSTAGYSTTFF